MFPNEPHAEHEWLMQLVGEWTFEFKDTNEAGESQMISGHETVRPLGKLWIIGESSHPMPGTDDARSMVTLGFDTRTKRFVGSWFGTMMSHLWVYAGGELDAGKTVLTLPSTGPNFEDPSKTNEYKDVIEIVDETLRTMHGYVRQGDGTWRELCSMTYRRK